MNIIDNLYSQGPMSPVCQIKEHLAIWTETIYKGFQVDWIEPIPRSSAFIIDLVALQGTGPLAPNLTIAGRLVTALQVNANELAHYRWFAIDDIEGQLWELANMARFNPRGGQAGVNLLSSVYDPWLASTTFWVLGGPGDKDARIGCTNISGAALPQARLGFFGFRYILTPDAQLNPNARYLPAQGR
jgi:hypothetical protein